jgi:hypothetical protein
MSQTQAVPSKETGRQRRQGPKILFKLLSRQQREERLDQRLLRVLRAEVLPLLGHWTTSFFFVQSALFVH